MSLHESRWARVPMSKITQRSVEVENLQKQQWNEGRWITQISVYESEWKIEGEREWMIAFLKDLTHCWIAERSVFLNWGISNSKNTNTNLGSWDPMMHTCIYNSLHVECLDSAPQLPSTESRDLSSSPLLSPWPWLTSSSSNSKFRLSQSHNLSTWSAQTQIKKWYRQNVNTANFHLRELGSPWSTVCSTWVDPESG